MRDERELGLLDRGNRGNRSRVERALGAGAAARLDPAVVQRAIEERLEGLGCADQGEDFGSPVFGEQLSLSRTLAEHLREDPPQAASVAEILYRRLREREAPRDRLRVVPALERVRCGEHEVGLRRRLVAFAGVHDERPGASDQRTEFVRPLEGGVDA